MRNAWKPLRATTPTTAMFPIADESSTKGLNSQLLVPSLPELYLFERRQSLVAPLRIYNKICSLRSLPTLHLFEQSHCFPALAAPCRQEWKYVITSPWTWLCGPPTRSHDYQASSFRSALQHCHPAQQDTHIEHIRN